ncbi:expressed unknown protein [Seminavis robusta]|uniref:Uncharacterized protein n=1 Tax=Seminavis robusta TaxID=568900 RepID=A0A9N8E7L9_9STRA|nr:expressed unknown protein [Seminavis robusta]CAB9514067.1 expressed unknown protein [Seminavis robusta]|eukprot:Sro630_g178290.1 n/a (125) ;mRNA; r:2760-3134
MGNATSLTNPTKDGATSPAPSPAQAAKKRRRSPRRTQPNAFDRIGSQDLDQIYEFVHHLKQTKEGEELLDTFVAHQAEQHPSLAGKPSEPPKTITIPSSANDSAPQKSKEQPNPKSRRRLPLEL